MKTTLKYTFLLIGLTIFSISSHAQDDRDFRIGFKIIPGFNWTKAISNDVQKDGTGIGFSFGLMSDIRLAENYFFSPELNITTMSNSMKLKSDSIYTLPNTGSSQDYNKISYKYNLKYIEIPLTFKFRTKESNGMRYWGQFGVAPGFLIGNNVTVLASPANTGTKNYPTEEKFIPNDANNNYLDFTRHIDDINFLRASMILGAGIEYNLSGNTSFYAGIRFNNGFTDILDDKKSKVINNVMGLELGFFF
jgi:opacity protein-like surface antigen